MEAPITFKVFLQLFKFVLMWRQFSFEIHDLTVNAPEFSRSRSLGSSVGRCQYVVLLGEAQLSQCLCQERRMVNDTKRYVERLTNFFVA